MENQSTQHPIPSAIARTDDDPFESVVISPRGGGVDDDGAYGNEYSKPQFVIDDDKNFKGA